MQLGYIGLGKMGHNMVERLLEKGHDVVVFNRSVEPAIELEKKGAQRAESLFTLIEMVKKPRLIWLMVPHKAVESVLEELIPHLDKGDSIIDGGNSFYKESIRHAQELTTRGVNFLDVGVSGGPQGAREGACLMIGGQEEQYKKYELLFKDIATKDGYEYVGESGAGHFVKMVHNGIEYGMMQAIAEGFAVMKKAPFNLSMLNVARIYNHGSVITSRLVEWLHSAYKEHGENLDEISGEISHSGEGQWTTEAAKKLAVLTPIIKGALEFRKKSQGNPSYTGQIVSALRNQFGGHSVEK